MIEVYISAKRIDTEGRAGTHYAFLLRWLADSPGSRRESAAFHYSSESLEPVIPARSVEFSSTFSSPLAHLLPGNRVEKTRRIKCRAPPLLSLFLSSRGTPSMAEGPSFHIRVLPRSEGVNNERRDDTRATARGSPH